MSVFPGRLSQKLDVQGSVTTLQNKTLGDENTKTGVQTSTGAGVGVSFAKVGNVITLTDAAASFTSADIGRFITVTLSVNNNGTFLVESCPGGTQLTWTNAAGANEGPVTAPWTINDPYCIEDDLNFERTDRKGIKGTTNYYDAVPTYARPSAVGETRPKNLTNLLSVDGYATVRDVKQTGIKLRPNITDTDGNLLVGDETFTTTKYHFNADDLNSFILISGGTAADGYYRIKTVTDGKTLELDGLNNDAAETCTWELISERKGILSSRGWADAVDRTGIPIADTGAEDETVYEATFTDVIDEHTNGRPTKNDETPIWARTYGDELDPNETATDEGTRFFVQLKTGVNDGTATTASLESLAGRSGSAAAMAGGNKVITGLTGMTQEDLGRYITLYECTDDNAGHYEIAVVTSATQVTVVRSANFTADSAVKWKVSKHPGTWDFYNGDRYQNNLLSETWARNTLIGGIVSDAELTQAIADLREFTGEDPHQTSPNLGSETGNYYVWSDLPDINNTNLEEMANQINHEIGNRDYSPTALSNVPGLADGQIITASIEALAIAIGSVSMERAIKRVASNISKFSDVTIPGGLTYKTGTTDGQSLYVYWRGILRDPGTVANGDDYAEKDNTTITVYSDVRAGDHMNFFILAAS